VFDFVDKAIHSLGGVVDCLGEAVGFAAEDY
jgi:hypothetical protein